MKTMLKHWMNAVEGSLVRIGLTMVVLGCGGLLHAETLEQVLARYKLSPVAYFDASVAESVECNADGGVTAWRDLSSRGNDLTDYKTNKGKRVRYADGRYPNAWVYDMGAAGSGIDLKLAVNLSIRSFVMVVDIANNNNNKSFFLGSGSCYYFHRGDNGQYAGKDGNNAWKTASGWENGVKIEDMQTSSPATGDLSLYTFNLNGSISWSRLSDDRNISGRNGGRKLALLICFDSVLSDEARLALEAAIKEKLTNTKPAVKVARQGFQPNGAYALNFALDWSGVGASTADIYLSVGESVDALGDEVHVGDDVALDASVAYEVAGLNKEHTYYYRVRTVNDLGKESAAFGRLTDPIEVTLAELGLKPQTHFDAANEFSFETNDEGKVIRWNGVENPSMDFGRWYATKNGTNFGSRKLYKDNWPVYDMGGVGSGIDLRRSALLTSKSVVMAVDLEYSPYAFFLAGDVYEFHRGEQGQYSASYACAGWQGASGCENGLAIDDMQTAYPKTGEISVYTFNMEAGGKWNSLSNDRNLASRNGGRQLGELMTFADKLTEEQRVALQTALIKKWRPQEQKAVTATWTGDAGDDNFANAGNWCCSNDLGEVKGVLPNALTAVTIPGELVMDIPVGAPLECKSIAVAGPFANDCDWSGLGSTIAGAGTIDLKGHKLTLTDLVGNYGITDSSEEGATPGELHIKVEKGETIQNTTVVFTGSLKIVKDGEGTLELGSILQSNTGGWEIAEGTVKAIAAPYSKTSTFFGKTGSTVVVREGATYDLNMQYDTRYYPFILDGGTIANRGGDESAAGGSMGPITLTKNSNFDVTYSFPLWGKVDLDEHTLTVNIADGKSLYLYKDGTNVGGTFENGTVIVTGGGYFAPDVASGTSRDMRTVDFRFEGPLAQTTSIDVRNLTMIYDDTKKSGSGKVNIYGIFTPSANNYLNNFVMQDGSTINLVGREGIYDTASTLTSQALDFGDNATILINVGERKLETNEKVVAWSAKPANVGGLTFKFIGKNLDYESVNAVVLDDGIYYPDVKTIVKATWTGADDGKLDNAKNWRCENALGKVVAEVLPSESTVVNLDGEIAFNVPNGASFKVGSLNANAALKDDCDWSGLDATIPVSGTIDLKGHKLTVTKLVGNYEITDATATDAKPGEFHINVENETIRNTAVTFTGSAKVVKDGEGTLELGAIKHSNTGGWEIAKGMVKASVNIAENFSFGQLGTTVVVREGATYDLNGQCDTRKYPFVLDGGTIANTGSGVNANYGCMGPITLTKNSYLNVASSFPLWGKVDLGGFTLTVNIASGKYLYLYQDGTNVGGIFENGTVVVTEGGYFAPNAAPSASRDMRTVDFNLDASLALTTGIDVRNLTMVYDGTAKSGTGSVNIYGVFTPSAKNYIHNFVMQDGSTLNLAGRDGVYDLTSSVVTGTSNVLRFADGATITVDPGERVGKIISWTAETKPADTVNFVLPDTAVGKLEVRDNGLYRRTGLIITFR